VELQNIATHAEIFFTGGNATVLNKDEIITALDEVSPQELAIAYRTVCHRKKS
jgi:hypothetical protein